MNNNNKESLKYLSMIFGGQLLVNTGPLLECGWYTYITTLKKSDFPSFSSYHLRLVSWLGLNIIPTFPLLFRLKLTQNLSQTCHRYKMSIFFLCMENKLIYHQWLLHSLCPLVFIDAWALRNCMKKRSLSRYITAHFSVVGICVRYHVL